ncbi:MlaD family protein [Nocardia sp. XZ_19_385]|uniref:MlaD family protein n=1 Tax=Nocardia sp. XZ_19_385 TaxID=2769488 RepID=UPI00188FE93A|nr:MlaD family protein [Nocardia sp. XZ_19_385]
MIKRILGAPGFVTVAGALALSIVTIIAYLIVFDPMKKTISYCAMMPDAVGLYPGNHVTMLGIPIGTVDTIRPEGAGVRVEFQLEAERALRGEVTATTVSDSLVADRNLAVLGDAMSADRWDPGTCITKTFTPKSISQTLQGFSQLADQLNGATRPGERTRIHDSVLAFEHATAGTGPALNKLIKDLGQALRAPDAAIGHIGSLLDSYSGLINSIAMNWDMITDVLARAGTGIAFINELWDTAVRLINSLLVILPWFNEMAREWGRPLLGALDGALPGLRLLAANVATLQQIVTMIPPIVDAFAQMLDPVTGKPRLTYAPPKVALPQEQADQICAAVNALVPGKCRTDANLVPLLLGSAGA